MALPPPILYDPARHTALLPSFAKIHVACVKEDYTLATFLNFSPDENGVDHKVLQYWEEQAAQVAAGTRVIIMQMLPSSDGHAEALAGFVTLDMGLATETGPFRAAVEKLLVDPRFRRRGIAKRMMENLEEVARGKGLTMLVGPCQPFSRAQQH
jgi:GNAT superfamily N-acetyltransferase